MNLAALFKLRLPCANCPFLKDESAAISLRPGRLAGIVENIMTDDQSPFMCHKTLGRPDESYCAGAMIYLDKARNPNVAMRLGCAFGLYDPASLADAYDDVIDPPNKGKQ